MILSNGYHVLQLVLKTLLWEVNELMAILISIFVPAGFVNFWFTRTNIWIRYPNEFYLAKIPSLFFYKGNQKPLCQLGSSQNFSFHFVILSFAKYIKAAECVPWCKVVRCYICWLKFETNRTSSLLFFWRKGTLYAI